MKKWCLVCIGMIAGLFLLGGCGGGSSSQTTDIVLVDGYIDGAHVRDSSDKNATPLGNGVYRFTGIVEGNITASGGSFSDSNLSNLFVYTIDGSQKVISPITHFLTHYPELEDILAQGLGVENEALYQDFIANDNLLLAQLAQILYAMEVNGLIDTFANAITSPQDIDGLIATAKSLTPGHARRLDIDVFLDEILGQDSVQIELLVKDEKDAMQSGDGDSTLPTLISSSPEDEANEVSRFSDIELIFSENVIGVDETSIQLLRGGTIVSSSLHHENEVVQINPLSALNYNTLYTVSLSGNITDPTGNALTPIEINFTTEVGYVAPPAPEPDEPEEPQSHVLKTGQTTIYYANDDGDLQRGVDRSYTNNEDGTITDNVTSLMWQQEDDNLTRDWDDANSYCNSLAFAGHSDWRLPTIKELQTLVDYGRYNPAIDPIFTNTNFSGYWSSTGGGFSGTEKWFNDFGDGSDYWYLMTNPSYVRCVR
jgi:hypothetical protein